MLVAHVSMPRPTHKTLACSEGKTDRVTFYAVTLVNVRKLTDSRLLFCALCDGKCLASLHGLSLRAN